MIDGKKIDLSQSKYQLQSYYIHLENNDPDVIHIHASGVDLKFIMETLGISFDKDCIRFDGREFCNSKDKKIKLYVNREISNEYEDYVPKDLDKILISFGNESESEIQSQLNLVADRSRIFSR